MPLPISEIMRGLGHLKRLNAPVPPGFWALSPATIAERCNGIGSDDPSTKWLVQPTTFVFRWMLDASIAHDLWWSDLYNDGSRKRFDLSNDGFRETLHLFANESFGAMWPHALRETFRASRRWQADRARWILGSPPCFEIWQKNKAFEPGPEVMG